MDPQTPGTHGETGAPVQPAFSAAPHNSHLPATNQPDLVKRFLAALIDSVGVAVIAVAVGMVSGILGAVAGLALWLLRDVALEGRSPGKKVMGLNVVTASGAPITPIDSIKRNATLSLGYVAQLFVAIFSFLGLLAAVPLWGIACIVGVVECVMVLTNQPRLGDKIAGTQVVVDGAPAVAV